MYVMDGRMDRSRQLFHHRGQPCKGWNVTVSVVQIGTFACCPFMFHHHLCLLMSQGHLAPHGPINQSRDPVLLLLSFSFLFFFFFFFFFLKKKVSHPNFIIT
jgi:hypothetical protein